MKIMIIEDDATIAEQICFALKKWNYQVLIATDFISVLEEFKSFEPDLVLIDIILPYYNGYHHCQEIRKISNLPIVFISSKAEDMDIVMAMQFGADDYITKPFSIEVLVAKIQALLRRSYTLSQQQEFLSYADVTYYYNRGTLCYQQEEVSLSKTEMTIMNLLLQAQGEIVAREKIMEQCWHGDDFIDDNTLAVNITRLRKKLKTIGLTDFIQTKKGIGYFLQKMDD